MLRTLPQTRSSTLTQRLIAIAIFTVLTIIGARIRLEFTPGVPFTMQTFVVLLAGLVLGWRDGFLSQTAYLGLIALNLPVDANGLGVAAFAGPTAGFLISFPFAAAGAGFLAERGGQSIWLRWAAGVIVSLPLLLVGVAWLSNSLDMQFAVAWGRWGQPFIVIEIAKALLAALVAEGGRAALQRFGNVGQGQ
jgi:biotin transport system substrate-specific component